jgi:uncharacterized C2H2 Zn-finger protein
LFRIAQHHACHGVTARDWEMKPPALHTAEYASSSPQLVPHQTHEGHAFQPSSQLHRAGRARVFFVARLHSTSTNRQNDILQKPWTSHQSGCIQNVRSINYYLSPSGPQIPRCNHGKKSSLDRQHLASPTHTVPCKQCKKPFSSSQALKQHLDSGIHEAKCSVCTKPFRDKPSLQQHINAAHNLNCSSCNKRFKTQKALSQHTTDIHRRRPTS